MNVPFEAASKLWALKKIEERFPNEFTDITVNSVDYEYDEGYAYSSWTWESASQYVEIRFTAYSRPLEGRTVTNTVRVGFDFGELVREIAQVGAEIALTQA